MFRSISSLCICVNGAPYAESAYLCFVHNIGPFAGACICEYETWGFFSQSCLFNFFLYQFNSSRFMQQRRLYANYVGQSLVHVTTVTPHSVFVVVVVVFFFFNCLLYSI